MLTCWEKHNEEHVSGESEAWRAKCLHMKDTLSAQVPRRDRTYFPWRPGCEGGDAKVPDQGPVWWPQQGKVWPWGATTCPVPLTVDVVFYCWKGEVLPAMRRFF
jgi:hypothetical protein